MSPSRWASSRSRTATRCQCGRPTRPRLRWSGRARSSRLREDKGTTFMTQFLQALLYGLLQGGLLALVAVGFSLVWGVMNVVNLSHGALVLIGAYIALQL